MCGKQVLLVLVLLVGVVTSTITADNPAAAGGGANVHDVWSGAWHTYGADGVDYGKLKFHQDEHRVTGRWHDGHGGGTIKGRVMGRNSNILEGRYQSASGASGTFRFEMDSDFEHFDGTWTSADGVYHGRWNGDRL